MTIIQKGELMGDLISRQAALDDIRTMVPKDAQLDIQWIEMWLKQLPSAHPQRMRGRWVEHKWAEEVAGLLISNYACSCCSSWERTKSDYCPNCGADMRGG